MRSLGLVLLLFSVGCQTPDDVVALRGTVNSDPPPDQVSLGIEREAAVEGLLCGSVRPLGSPLATDAGRYDASLIRIEVEPPSAARRSCLRARAVLSSGTSAWADVKGGFNDLTLPALTDWRPGLALAADGTVAYAPAADREPAACVGMTTDGVLHHLVAAGAGGVFWAATDGVIVSTGPEEQHIEPRPLRLEPEMLEDLEGSLTLQASRGRCGDDTHPFPPETVHPLVQLGWEAAERLPVHGALVPVSRGASCPALGTPCPLTDGLVEPFDLPSGTKKIALELGAPASIRVAVLRSVPMWPGGTLELVLRVLPDVGNPVETQLVLEGDSWPASIPEAQDAAGNRYVILPAGFARFVLPPGLPVASRYELEWTSGLYTLSELSLFE